MSRIVLIAVTLVVWTGLVWRLGGFSSPPAPGGDAATGAATDEPGEPGLRWVAGVFRGDARVGRATTEIWSAADGHRLAQRTELALTVLNEPARVDSTVSAVLESDFSLRSVAIRMEGGGSRLVAEAERRGDAIEYDVETMGSRSRGRIDVDGPIYLPVAARIAVARDLGSGREDYRFTVLDPLGLATETLAIHVAGEARVPGYDRRRGWRLEERYRGLESSVWVDSDGRVLAEQGPMGLAMRLEDGAGAASLAPLDVESTTAVFVGTIERPRTRGELVLRIGGVEASLFPQGGAQSLEGDRLLLRRVEPGDVGTYPLPAKEWQTDLAPTRLVRSDHRRIRALAAEILDGEDDALAAGQRLGRWVYEYLEKGPVLSVPDAVGVLDAGRGDCNEHAVLFAALARAAGLPTRLVAGLVYVDGKFVYHAWNEIRGARGWLPVDTALGQFPADVTHVALVYGELADQMRLAKVVGKLQLSPES